MNKKSDNKNIIASWEDGIIDIKRPGENMIKMEILYKKDFLSAHVNKYKGPSKSFPRNIRTSYPIDKYSFYIKSLKYWQTISLCIISIRGKILIES